MRVVGGSLMFTSERKAEPILVGTLTIRKTFTFLDTGTSMKKILKKEERGTFKLVLKVPSE